MLIINTSSPQESVEYSRESFKDYVNDKKYIDSVSKMMTYLMFKEKMLTSPYTDLNEDYLWNKVTNMFINDCCTILSMYHSLYVLINK